MAVYWQFIGQFIGDVGGFANAAADFEAVEVGQADVEDHAFGPGSAGDGVSTRAGREHNVSVRAQGKVEDFGDAGVVLDDENFH